MVLKELDNLKWGVVLFAGIIITLILIALIAGEFRTVRPTTEGYSVINESKTFVGSSVVISTADRYDFLNLNTGTNLIMTNGTNNTIGTNNYEIKANGSIILGLGCNSSEGGIGEAAKVNVTYSATITSSSYYYNVSTGGLNTIQNISKQNPVLGTLLVLLVIAAIAFSIFTFFGGRKTSF